MPAARGPPTTRAPDASVAQELGEFTDRQMAQLRGVIEESLRAVLLLERGASHGCQHEGGPSCGHQHSDGANLVGVVELDGGPLGHCGTSQSSAVGGALSLEIGGAASPGSKKATRGRSVEENTTRKLVKEIRGSRESLCSDGALSPMRTLIMASHEGLKSLCHKLVHENPYFDSVMGVVIIANSAVIGIETQMRLDNENEETHLMFWIESLFLVCFVTELIARWLSDGRKNLSSGWFWFDLSLVVTGVIYTWIVDPILAATSQDLPIISQLLTLRVLRLMRLVRALRLMEQFKELWKLCSGLLRSSRTMLSVCLLVLISIFVFACLGVDLISTSPKLINNETTRAIVEEHFSSLMVTILTLMQFANADSLASVYLPLCKEEPSLVLYFLVMWLVITVALMNLVTAVIVENAMANGREDAEEMQIHLRRKLRKILPEIDEVFDGLDTNGNNALEIEELIQAAEDGVLTFPEDIKSYVDPSKLLDIFEFLDANQSGVIERQEFFEGICHLVVSSVPLETTQILQLVRKSHDMLSDLSRAFLNSSVARTNPPGSTIDCL